MKKAKVLGMSLVPLLLVSCGGGGGGGGSSSPSAANYNQPYLPNIPNTPSRPSIPKVPIVAPVEIEIPPVPTQPTINTPIVNQPSRQNTQPNTASNFSYNSLKPSNSIGSRPTINQGDIERVNKRTRWYLENDENKVRDIAVIDSDFHNLKEFNGRLTENVPTGRNWEASSQSHGTLVSYIIATNNKTSKIYGMRSGSSNGSNLLSISSDMYSDAFNLGGRIFNHSYGEGKKHARDEFGIEIPVMKYFLQKNASQKETIHVWASGNDSRYYTTQESLYPNFDSEFKNSFVAVAAVTDMQAKNRSSLTWYSNKIGDVAKTWGITAQGNYTSVKVHDKDNKEVSITNSGTSFAAPVVTAVAANIWEKFPWMDNHLVLVTLFSTASNPHTLAPTSSPDNVFGWGLVDNNRALKGPARFDTLLLTNRDYEDKDKNKYLAVNLSHRNYKNLEKLTWSNDIKGDAGIYKKGDGTLYLSGANDYSGKTWIEDGTLAFSNSLRTKQVFIDKLGTLHAENKTKIVSITSNETFTNKGSLNVYGKGLTINSNYKSEPNSRIVIDIKDSSLNVTGNMDMSGSHILADIKDISSVPKNYQNTKTIITANSITNYDGKYTISDTINPYINISYLKQISNKIDVSYQRNSTNYVLSRTSFLNLARSAAAENLDRAFETLSTNNSTNYTALAFLNAAPANLAAMIDTISGQIHPQTQEILSYQNSIFDYQLSQRIALLAIGAQSGSYADGLYSKFKIGGKAGFANANISTKGGFVGYDAKVDDATFGFAITQAKSEADFDKNGGSNKIDYLGFTGYTAYKFDDFYMTLKATIANAKSKVSREVVAKMANSSYKTMIYDIASEIGYIAELDKFSITPFFGLQYSYAKRDGFKEDVDFGITSRSKSHQKASATAGLRAQYSLENLNINANYTQKRILNSGDYGFKARYSNIGSEAYIRGDKEAKNLSFVGVVASYNLTKNISLNLSYDVNLRDFDRQNSTIRAGIYYKFN